MAAIFPNRRFLGKRLTCPVCKDSAFFSNFELAEMGGSVYCDNHDPVVEMVDLADLLAIWGIPQRVELKKVDFFEDSHPDDFEDWSMSGLEREEQDAG